MLDDIVIAEELKGSFRRIFRKMPKRLQKNKAALETIIAYLKIGGEKLAKQSVEAFKSCDRLETDQRKKKLRNEALIRAAEARKIKEATESTSFFKSPEDTKLI